LTFIFIVAWIPIWAFGRKFEDGKNTERLPEQSLGILMGMFGSAFVASLAHFYQEIRLLLPSSAVQKADEMINSYQASVSTIHPISPASFPNPFYKMSTTVQTKDESQQKEEVLRSESLVESELIGLMDAGMDNNIPFYPLLRQGRDVDIILAIDLSADIQDAPNFDRAEGYIKRRGIKGWPTGAGWPRKDQQDEKNENSDPVTVDHHQQKKPKEEASNKEEHSKKKKTKYALDTCTVFESSSSETIPSNDNGTSTTTTSYPENTNPITLVYFPLIVNDNYDPEFDPQAAEFCSTWNFVYSSVQVNKLHGLAEANVKDNLEKVRKVVKETWKRKRDERLKKEDLL
jgi:phospholipase A2